MCDKEEDKMAMPTEHLASRKRDLKRKNSKLYEDATSQEIQSINNQIKNTGDICNVTYDQLYGEE